MPTGDQAWSLASYFPVFDGEEFRAFKADLVRDIAAQTRSAAALAPLGSATLSAWAAVFTAYEQIGARLAHLDSYLGCLPAADAAEESYQTELAWLSGLEAGWEKLKDRAAPRAARTRPRHRRIRILARGDPFPDRDRRRL